MRALYFQEKKCVQIFSAAVNIWKILKSDNCGHHFVYNVHFFKEETFKRSAKTA